MTDTLKAPVGFGMSANLLSQLGFVTMTDNHGNGTRGLSLTCAGKSSTKMTSVEAADLHYAIVPHAALAFNFNGEIPLGDLESPLQSLCRKLDAKAHHTSGSKPTAHTK